MSTYSEKKLYGRGFTVLSDEDIEKIHNASAEILEDTGVYIASKKAQELMNGIGCIIDKENNRVRIPKNVVIDALASLPKIPQGMQLPVYGRDGDELTKITAGADEITISCSGVCTNILDPFTGERRLPTLKDVEDTAKLCDAVPEILNYQIAVSAEDVPKELMVLYQHAAILKNYTKMFSNMNENPWIFGKQIRMLQLVAGGADKLMEKPFFGYGLDPISPLAFDTNEIEMTIMGVEAGLSPSVFNDTMAGATGPATLAGALTVSVAEYLAGIVFVQSIQRGAFVSIGTSSSIFDMKVMNMPIGAAEHALYSVAVGQFAKYYGVGCTAGAG